MALNSLCYADVPLSNYSLTQGSFRRGTRGNAVPVVEKLPERKGTGFPLLKCLRTPYGQTCEPFPGKNARDTIS